MSQMNASKTWSVTEMQQYLIEQENAMNVLNEKGSMQEESALEVHTRGGYRGRGRGGSFRGGFRGGRGGPSLGNVYRASAVDEMFQQMHPRGSRESPGYRGNYRGNNRGNYRGNFRGNSRGNFRGRYENQHQHSNHHANAVVCGNCNRSGHVARNCSSIRCVTLQMFTVS